MRAARTDGDYAGLMARPGARNNSKEEAVRLAREARGTRDAGQKNPKGPHSAGAKHAK